MRKVKTLSKVIKLRDNTKKEIEIEVSRAAVKADHEKERLETLKNNYEDTLRFFRKKQEEGKLNTSNLISYYDFFSRIDGKIKEQKKVHDKCQDELSSLRDSLLRAHRDKKVVEILKDKVVQRCEREKAVSEQKDNDFFALSRRLR